jgi:dTDP-4-dehydrorhamnose reductase
LKILLIGRTGQLGGSILAEPRGHQVYAPGRDELDVESLESCERMIARFRPDVVINTAAFHNVPQCEVEPLRAFAVNCQAVRNLAAVCKRSAVRLVTFSTDYVFGGEKRTPYREDDRTGPVQMYGISRLAGELAALTTAPEHAIIVRTCGLYGPSGAASKGGNFVDRRIADAQTQAELEMGCDQIVSPTYTYDLANAVLRLIEHPQASAGIYHLVNEGECTWFEFTRTIYDLMGLKVHLQPADRGGMSGDMRRPLYSALANTKARALGIVMPHWQNGLQRYLRDKYHLDHNARLN